MKTRLSRVLWPVLCIVLLHSAAAGDADGDYKLLFGEEEAKVAASRSPAQAAAFAAKLLNAAQSVGQQKDLQALLCDKAFEFASKDASAHATAIEALKLQMQALPDRREALREKLMKALQVRLARGGGAERQALAEDLLDVMLEGAEELAEDKPAEAAAMLRQALTVATGARSERTREIMERIKDLNGAVETEKKHAALKGRLQADPRNAAIRMSLILLYLGELDDPAEAAKLVSPDLDERVRTYLPLTAKPVGELAEAACLELASWYSELADKAPAAGQATIMGRAKTCAERFLELHTTQDVNRLKGQMLLGKIAKAIQSAQPPLRKTFTLNLGKGVAMKFVLIPAGTFMMGPEEGAQHEVTLTKPFYMHITEVTQAQYLAVTGKNPSEFVGPTRPVDRVSWDDAAAFCKKLSQRTRREFRLPTEAEWEYACRAGSRTKYCFGDDDNKLIEYGWHNFKGAAWGTHPVGTKKPNAFGLYDMHGNLWEWCNDWYAPYPAEPQTDPQGPQTGTERVQRGGGWYYKPSDCRSANRGKIPPSFAGPPPLYSRDYTFRIATDAKRSGPKGN